MTRKFCMIGIGPCWFARQLLTASSQISRWHSLVANNFGSRLAVCSSQDNFPSAITGMTSSLLLLMTPVIFGSCWPPHRPMPPSLTSAVHMFEAAAGSLGLWALLQSAESWVEPQSEIKIAKKYRWNDIWGRVFVNVVSRKYIGLIYINLCEMCFIPMNVHNELLNGVCQLRWQHLSPVVSTFSTSIRLLSSFFIKHCILPPSFSLFLLYPILFS